MSMVGCADCGMPFDSDVHPDWHRGAPGRWICDGCYEPPKCPRCNGTGEFTYGGTASECAFCAGSGVIDG